MALIKCDKLSLGYEGIPTVDNVNFEINGGEYLCIVGENGTGKSTLIKGLLRLKKPMSGKIIYGDGLKNNEIGYLPQQSQLQRDFPASVYEVVISGKLNSLGMRPFFTLKEKRDVMEKLEMMGIKDLKDKCYHDLSGGQQQRVLLARAMCATKKLILLDEPVTGLDPIATSELYELIKHINNDHKITVIMVSHDMEATLKYASHILHLSHESMFFGTREEYLESEYGRKFVDLEEA